MKQSILDIRNNHGKIVTRGSLSMPEKGKAVNLIIVQSGLGSSDESSELSRNIRDAIATQTSGCTAVFGIDHPWHGLNYLDPKPHLFSTQRCVEATNLAVKHILKELDPQKVLLVGSSLGFWSLFQTLTIHAEDHRIIGILGKSGIVSYKAILERLLNFYCEASPYYKGWKKMLKHFNVDPETSWGKISANPNDEPVKVHRNFFLGVKKQTDTVTNTGKHVEVWHGTNDQWSYVSEMKLHHEGNITVHEQEGAGHSLDGTDAHSQIVARVFELLKI